MPEFSHDAQGIIDAVRDLTRVTLALQGDFISQSDAIRRLHTLSIPPVRIAAILAMPAGDVHSVLAKAKKRAATNSPKARRGETAQQEAQ